MITFERLLSDTAFAADMQRLMKTIEGAYSYPVVIEFTITSTGGGLTMSTSPVSSPSRPGGGERVGYRGNRSGTTLFRSEGFFRGGNNAQGIKR